MTRSPVLAPATRLRFGRLGLAVLGAYLVLIGGTEVGRLHPELRAINGVVAGGILAAAIARPWRRPDGLALATIAAVLGFCAAAILSPFPRAALDPALSAVVYAAAFLLLRDALSDASAYVWSRQMLAMIAVAFIVGFSLLWLGSWLTWLSATRYTLAPPLTLPLPTIFIRHPHVVAFTAVLLLPAVWALPRSRVAHVLRAVATAGSLFLVIASGSRTILLAATIAAVAVYGTRWAGRLRVTRRRALGAGTVVAVVVLAISLAGGGAFLVQRILTLGTLAARGEIWGATLAGWLERPLSGFGPGSYSLALPLTGYFDRITFSPRHADNALVQLLFEGGVIAFLLVVPLVVIVLRSALFAPGRREAGFAVLALALGSLTDNPTDTVGLVALGIFWAAAVTASRQPAAAPDVRGRTRPMWFRPSVPRAAAWVAVAVIAVAWGSITAADFAYAGARRAAGAASERVALQRLELAAALDPSNAFYLRQLAARQAAGGDLPAAAATLETAIDLNHADDVAARSLALVYLELERHADAERLARTALELRRTDVMNHLVRARVDLQLGRDPGGRESAADALARSHWLAAAAGWGEFLGSVRAEEVTRSAAARASEPGGIPGSDPIDVAWLLALDGRTTDAVEVGTRERSATAEAVALMLGCELGEASRVLRDAIRIEGSQGTYWLVRYIVETVRGADTGATEQMLRLLVPGIGRALYDGGPRASAVSPMADEVRDSYLYHRLPIRHDAGAWRIPDPDTGATRWLQDPAEAATLAAPRSRLAACLDR